MVLLTGATGFLGKFIIRSLTSSDCFVRTLGRGIKNDILCDLSLSIPELKDDFSCIIHCSGKAHIVPKTTKDEESFFHVNVTGTKNLLKALELMRSRPKYFVFISTVAVYGRVTANLINEESALLAKDAYGLSKILAERTIQDWCNQHNIICTVLRLPLLAGSNPPGNLRSMIRGIAKGYYFDIAGGKARKSVVLAEDVASIITLVAKIGGIYNLTDRCHPSFSELSESISNQLGKSKPFNIPLWMAQGLARIGDILGKNAPINSNKLVKITSDLTFDDTKAVESFQWNPTPVLNGFKIQC
ncbi:MAG: NAD-dependent epimerase/dehydratase family protein [Candidatus Pedobacter colombiensis]|uniref:NAD-dependent epimerase/dehydratase family protein n=1 Tax=Candidatus Pedobacter colombiensis TaxID=3121371 RepID=A0AAJ5W8S0_9SPHI|nr:NAD-dependent epimerase/dehydratase family protein [Pedobacter sp.]WEK19685.1 MAG: NAD-dependent epimerase/dehydratase family protein [Pedobacter sp.]